MVISQGASKEPYTGHTWVPPPGKVSPPHPSGKHPSPFGGLGFVQCAVALQQAQGKEWSRNISRGRKVPQSSGVCCCVRGTVHELLASADTKAWSWQDGRVWELVTRSEEMTSFCLGRPPQNPYLPNANEKLPLFLPLLKVRADLPMEPILCQVTWYPNQMQLRPLNAVASFSKSVWEVIERVNFCKRWPWLGCDLTFFQAWSF